MVWSRVNLDLYHFHLRTWPSSIPPALSSPSPRSSQLWASQESNLHSPFCLSWNEEQCRWLFGRCTGRFQHCCSNCKGDHFKINGPFPHFSLLFGIAGDGTDWQDCPGDGSVNSVNSVLALSSWLCGLPESAEACFGPIFEPCVTVPIFLSFTPLAQFVRSHFYAWTNFSWNCAITRIGQQ